MPGVAVIPVPPPLQPLAPDAVEYHARSVRGERLSAIAVGRDDGAALVEELIALLEAHRAAGSAQAGRLLHDLTGLTADVWVVEPLAVPAIVPTVPVRPAVHAAGSVDEAARSTVAAG